MVPLSQLPAGQSARVIRFNSSNSTRMSRLATFGLGPGCTVTVRQHHFVCVVMVDETEIAIDPDVAREIMVQPK